MVDESMEPIKAKKFVMFRAWFRIEVYADCAFNKISRDFYSIGLRVDVRKLHVWYFVHNIKFCIKVRLVDSGDCDAKKPGLVFILYYKTLFIVAWFYSYKFDVIPMG